MEVSIILINYNTPKLLENCIDSIITHTTELEYEIIVVDNASKDNSKEIFEKDSRIKYIYSDVNLGFGKANNLGSQYSAAKYLFFLNSDTLLTGNAVKKMFQFMEKHDSVSACGMFLKSEEGMITHSYGFFPTFWSECFPFLFSKQESHLATSNVDYITGADLFIRKSDFDLVGGFDKEFFMYYEETDLQKRLSNLGKHAVILPDNDIIHFDGGSFESAKETIPIKRLQMQLDSRLIYMRKHMNRISYVLFRLIYACIMFPISIRFNCNHSDKYKFIKTFLS